MRALRQGFLMSSLRWYVRRYAVSTFFALTGALAGGPTLAQDALDVGRTLYRQGRLSTGEPLHAVRMGGLVVSGADAACVNCHRPSGLGTAEGRSMVPPITGPYLFGLRADSLAFGDRRRAGGPAVPREAYTDETLIRAIRDGVDHLGRPLDVLMPRYRLANDEAAALVAYLKALSTNASPGIQGDTIHFATVIAGDVDAGKKKVLLKILRAWFAERNVPPRTSERRVMPSAQAMLKAFRKWELHVWELKGAAPTWASQLREHYQRQPAFAVVGGITDTSWEPIHRYCEGTGLPCLFPIVPLPIAAASDFYSYYFSQGVELEARILARHLLAIDKAGGVQRIKQVFRTGHPGAAAAAVLNALLRDGGWSVDDHPVTGRQIDVAALIGDNRATAVVLWLDEPDLRALPAGTLPASAVYISGTLADGDAASLPATWRRNATIVYPFELPERRRDRLAPFRAWRDRHGFTATHERVQMQTFFAASALGEVMPHLNNNPVRDYLVERLESMTGRPIAGSIYPRVVLGQGQRFASRGGYIARFAAPDFNRLIALGEWIVP
jgi:mono/diheme cytochrome c family protein